ncbi:hypothetical protein BKH41_00670 [Helicobacter sp. 12S02232-10]|uniref:hypothetical protein n=1 Tax=Helicobacter sp. 12S02232-10 TaxID=1476197 RepID=UPI000BA7590A|nr:hypothetical protein [Helicobacter sp. 12S02232-10]PAF49848.1 hypothetical protein BKH41_00670 [Helicobacter sp. 12S02232-10]
MILNVDVNVTLYDVLEDEYCFSTGFQKAINDVCEYFDKPNPFIKDDNSLEAVIKQLNEVINEVYCLPLHSKKMVLKNLDSKKLQELYNALND